MRGSRTARGTRGQTLPDFAVGVAIFLVTTSAIFVFLPQLALPFDDQEDSLVVQRAAADLGETLQADWSPSALNETCTVAFFERNDVAGCPFEGGESVTAQLGIPSTYAVNVTVRDVPSDAPNSTVCRANDSETVGDCASGDENLTLAVGPSLPSDEASVAVARRGAHVDGNTVVVEVGVW